jgi:hypothetical protein
MLQSKASTAHDAHGLAIRAVQVEGRGRLLWLWVRVVLAIPIDRPWDGPRVARRTRRGDSSPHGGNAAFGWYQCALLVLGGEAWLFPSLPLLLYPAVAAVGCHLFVVLYEEPTLRRRFGAEYELYRSTVWRWIPHAPDSTTTPG